MRFSRRKLLMRLTAGALAAPALFRTAWAQAFPTRPITIIVPFAAGGPTDSLTRVVAERMQGLLGQPVIVENVAGAGGSIGVGRVARAAPDGYTLGLGIWSTHVVNGAVYHLPYDVLNDFAPIVLMTDNAQIIVARKTLPADDMKSFIAWLKANPGKALEGTAGVGSPQHIFGLLLQQETGTQFAFVHYRGGAPAMQDLLAGQIDFIVGDQTTALPQVHAGTVKAYVVTSRTRLRGAPDVPTVDEAGFPTFHTSVWNAFFAPKGTPARVIFRLNGAVVETLSEAAVRERLEQIGQYVVPREEQTPDALARRQKTEIEKWWPIIKAAGIKAN